ncbi:GGDEF domain-containing protein [Thauera humireducens]|uniref:GGDEF domain-containing protein n=1 Tax=Thauera humireducens TaxID=1134435 RepID=UPI00311F4F69
MFADADHFKRINDTWGHNAGDEVLRAFSASLKAQVRDHIDWVVRYGGEEFVIVLPETTLDRARALAERIRVVVESEPLTIDDRPIRLTASFGVAQYAPGEALADWIDRADKWLYLAKEQGRNRVCG